MSLDDRYNKEKINLVKWAGNWIYLADSELLPVRQQNIIDEIHQKEQELGGVLRFQRDSEGRYP